MAFYPDIVVTEPGSSHALVVVEAKASGDPCKAESQLRRYMWEMSCPVGLLASPDEIAVFRNVFTNYSEESIQRVGVFPAPHDWTAFRNRGSAAFEHHVQEWLEALTRKPASSGNGPDETLKNLVIPGLLTGEIHAAGPRISR